MKVEQLMTRPVWTCEPGDSLQQAARLMWDHDVGCVVVRQGSHIVGVITDRDVCMGGYTTGVSFHAISVRQSMTPDPFVIHSRASVDAAEGLMRRKGIRRLPVVDESGALVGLLSLNDVAREAARQLGRRDLDVSCEGVAATLAALCAPHQPTSIMLTTPPEPIREEWGEGKARHGQLKKFPGVSSAP